MQTVVNASETTQSVATANSHSTVEDSYIIRIEMIDGTSQLVHLSMDQAMALGVHNISLENKEKTPKKPSTMLNYKIVQPAELNLYKKEEPEIISNAETGLTRGRPKKRPGEAVLKSDVVEVAPPKLCVSTSRTRCGRITKPPTHMEKDYEKIVTNVKGSMKPVEELHTAQFEPIKTRNNITEPPPLVSLESNPKKRNIPAQYKCPTCKKAYLGRNRMAAHLKKNPDHGATNQMMQQDCNSWNFLIETALKANKGKRGEKFCKELISLVKNARVMAKNFLRPATVKSEFVVDSLLAKILDIKEGDYRFNESGICKDVNIFSFLLDDSFLESVDSNTLDTTETTNELCFANPPSLIQPAKKFMFTQGATSTSNELTSIEDVNSKPVNNVELNSDITYLIDITEPKKKLFAPTKTSPNKTLDNHFEILHIFNEDFNDKSVFSSSASTSNDAKENNYTNNEYLVKKKQETNSEDTNQQDHVGKEVDIFRKTIPNILSFDVNDEHMSTPTEKEKKKSEEFDLNKLHLVEFLPDAPVANILDTSIGSDDVMNVDQFVNERFTNLTEPGVEIVPDSPIALDLPCFTFNN
ncbi:uncharacterized protein [Atheta coriaria]|uniref:uncharacterized protein n=1 Tax=Dalotia coriaria TaxID=877792 RepID=UPI0031F35EE2